MQIVQLKHIKLWQAGTAPNWRLADFEVDQIRDMSLRTAIFYRDNSVGYVVAVEPPLTDMNTASAAGDAKNFVAAYEKLTAACNACHQAANVGFIVIKTRPSRPSSTRSSSGLVDSPAPFGN